MTQDGAANPISPSTFRRVVMINTRYWNSTVTSLGLVGFLRREHGYAQEGSGKANNQVHCQIHRVPGLAGVFAQKHSRKPDLDRAATRR
jgi:hypothetical protein